MYDINIVQYERQKVFLYFALFVLLIMMAMFLSVLILSRKPTEDIATNSSSVECMEVNDVEYNRNYMCYVYHKISNNEYECASPYLTDHYPENGIDFSYKSSDPSKCSYNFVPYENETPILVIIAAYAMSIGIPTYFFVITIKEIKTLNRIINSLTILNTRGKLIKNYPCKIVSTNMYVNNVNKKKFIINYNGTIIETEPRLIKDIPSITSKADLLIDESNPNINYIDLEINRISGNLESDYYKDTNTQNN